MTFPKWQASQQSLGKKVGPLARGTVTVPPGILFNAGLQLGQEGAVLIAPGFVILCAWEQFKRCTHFLETLRSDGRGGESDSTSAPTGCDASADADRVKRILESAAHPGQGIGGSAAPSASYENDKLTMPGHALWRVRRGIATDKL